MITDIAGASLGALQNAAQVRIVCTERSTLIITEGQSE